MSRAIRVLVNGAKGRMGLEAVKAVGAAKDMVLAGETDLGDDLAGAIRAGKAAVVVDFTRPADALRNFETAILAGARVVSGTTGFTPNDLEAAEGFVRRTGRGGAVVPNFGSPRWR
jgi:4-hydroxy-tetrahydrodipicolinate reductase